VQHRGIACDITDGPRRQKVLPLKGFCFSAVGKYEAHCCLFKYSSDGVSNYTYFQLLTHCSVVRLVREWLCAVPRERQWRKM